MSQRALLRKGDESSAGDVALEGIDNVQHYGVPRTFVGAEAWGGDLEYAVEVQA
ncbi:TPA: hypothetical protein QDA86_003018 [Burkholderia vietnamiensis]|nr:hypothetical protein [Burkholderia vietnamiensis]